MRVADLLQVLLDMRDGQVASDCNEKFSEVLSAVLQTGGKGELTIKLIVQPSKMSMAGGVLEVEMKHACKLKKPEIEVGRSIHYVAPDGSLTRTNPAQTAMFEGTRKEVKQS